MRKMMTIVLMAGVVLPGLTLLLGGCGKKDNGSTAADYWLTDFEQAKQIAQQKGKDILINFSGSDWCYWCKKLDKEVFSMAAFHEQAGEQYVFVLIDFPHDKSGQSAQIRQQNERLSQRFGIEGYPTVLLTDAGGMPYARTGYIEGGVQRYLDHLKELKNQPITAADSSS